MRFVGLARFETDSRPGAQTSSRADLLPATLVLRLLTLQQLLPGDADRCRQPLPPAALPCMNELDKDVHTCAQDTYLTMSAVVGHQSAVLAGQGSCGAVPIFSFQDSTRTID